MSAGSIAESQVTPQMMGQVAPDVLSPQGGQQMFQKMAKATLDKKGLDAVFKAIADKYEGNFTSRIKAPQTVAQKIVQKRVEGRDYGLDNVNDLYGARLIMDKKNFPKALKDIEKIADVLNFKINKSEDASHGTYEGYHVDMQGKDGNKFEVQLHTPQSNLEATVNHTMRSQFGENPQNDAVQTLREKQAKVAKDLPNDKANVVAQALQKMSSNQGGQISPTQSAQALAMAQGK